LISSQVSTIAPEMSGRWSKERRLAVVWNMIRNVRPDKLITHRFPVEKAQQAYDLLDRQPESAVQVATDLRRFANVRKDEEQRELCSRRST
jgi:threonine dehydrogenase-like Zn-dependent dehydrogenase